MILEELTQLYEHLIQDEEKVNKGLVFPSGFSNEGIGFRIIITENGEFQRLEDLRQMDGKNIFPIRAVVPKWEGKRTSGIKPYFLWDNSKYIIGKDKDKNHKDKNAAFISYIDEVCRVAGIQHRYADAVRRFASDEKQKRQLLEDPNSLELLESQSFTGFAITGASHFLLTDEVEVRELWKEYLRQIEEQPEAAEEALFGGKYEKQKEDIEKRHSFPEHYIDLLSGAYGPVYSIYPTVKKAIGKGGKNDVPFVSFNAASFRSYNKKSNFNAPISRKNAFAFTTALNYLMNDENHNRFIGDTRTLYWAEKSTEMENMFGLVMGFKSPTETHDAGLQTFIKSLQKGIVPLSLKKDNTRFFILGLAPNSARISVKYWYNDTVSSLASHLTRHLRDAEIVGGQNLRFPTVRSLLRQTAAGAKDENIPSPQIAALYRSVLEGYPYPPSMLSLLLNRMRNDKDDPKKYVFRIGYYRAAFIKAVLNRNYKKEMSMALDKNRRETAYLCGRLFAVLEKTQKDALGEGLNATIKDRYFSSASTNPRVVFPQIIRLSQNHLKKLKGEKPAWAVHNEKMIQEIMEGISNFPAFHNIEQQGEFAIGYYHQVQDFYQKKDKGERKNGTN